jgi:hypothetical protein
MEQNDLQILRYAALEIQANNGDLIRVAGVVQHIKDWWKTRRDKKNFQELKSPIENVLKRLDTAVRSQDSDTVERITTVELPDILSKSVQKAESLRDTMLSHTSPEWRSEQGEPIAGEDLRWVSKDYRKDKSLVEKLWEKLPEEFRNEIPVGRYIGQPITNFSWYKHYGPQDISMTDNVKARAQEKISGKLLEAGVTEDQLSLADWAQFFESLKEVILSSSILDRVNFAAVSKEVERRRTNEMNITVNPPEIFLTVGESQVPIKIDHVELIDLGTRLYNPELYELSVKGIWPAARSRHYKLPVPKTTVAPAVVAPEVPAVEPEEVSTASDGPITKIVKRALLRNALPKTNAIIKINGPEYYNVQFARVLASALRQEIDAECSVRHQDKEIEIQASVYGSKIVSLSAIFGISKYIASEFLNLTKVGIDIEVVPGNSKLDIIESKTLDQSFRKVAFDCWRIK